MYRFRLVSGMLMSFIVLGLNAPVRAQDLTMDFVYGGIDDAEQILREYLRPYANVLGSDLNAGWYNTARPHKLGGLDVTATVSWAKAPLSALTYDLNELNLSDNAVKSPDGLAPTIAGKQESRPEVSYSQSVDLGEGSQDVEYARYTLPDGTGVDFFPLPMGQLTVGLPLGTDVSARFVPQMGLSDYGEIGLWGVGGKHSISQWLPFIKRLKFLDISLQGGYTKVTSSAYVLVEPQDVEVIPDKVYNWDDQLVIQKVEGWSTNLISSQTVAVFTFYQGIGYASSLVELELEGHYPIHSVITEEGDNLGKTTYEVVEDPIEMEYKNFNNLRVNVGARIKLGVFTLHYDFTHTLYSTHSVGMGISFR